MLKHPCFKCSISSRDVLLCMHRTISPVSETQDYDYLHHVKGAVKSWSFRDDMCRIESQKDIKCVPFIINICICEMSCSHAQNTLQPRHQSMKLRIMTISIKTKVLNKFGTSEMKCVELRAKKL